MASNIGLSVRQHERGKIRLPIEFIVCDEHREQVRFSSSSSAGRPHEIQGMVTDISRGGLGFDSQLYLPRMCEGKVKIFDGATTVSQIDPVPVAGRGEIRQCFIEADRAGKTRISGYRRLRRVVPGYEIAVSPRGAVAVRDDILKLDPVTHSSQAAGGTVEGNDIHVVACFSRKS